MQCIPGFSINPRHFIAPEQQGFLVGAPPQYVPPEVALLWQQQQQQLPQQQPQSQGQSQPQIQGQGMQHTQQYQPPGNPSQGLPMQQPPQQQQHLYSMQQHNPSAMMDPAWPPLNTNTMSSIFRPPQAPMSQFSAPPVSDPEFHQWMKADSAPPTSIMAPASLADLSRTASALDGQSMRRSQPTPNLFSASTSLSSTGNPSQRPSQTASPALQTPLGSSYVAPIITPIVASAVSDLKGHPARVNSPASGTESGAHEEGSSSGGQSSSKRGHRVRKLAGDLTPSELEKMREINRVAARRHRWVEKQRKLDRQNKLEAMAQLRERLLLQVQQVSAELIILRKLVAGMYTRVPVPMSSMGSMGVAQ